MRFGAREQNNLGFPIKTSGMDEIFIICLYVDELIYIDNNIVSMEEFKKMMLSEFEMIDLKLMSYFFRLEVK